MKRPMRKRGRGIKEILSKGKNFLKNSKLISKTLNNIAPHWVAAKPLSMLASSYGYGKPKRRRRGKGKVGDWFKNAFSWIKKNKIVSTVANALAPVLPIAGTVGKVAGAAGFGRKRKRLGARRGRGPFAQTGSGYGGSNAYSSGMVVMGKKRGMTSRRGRGIGHLNTPYTPVGMAGATRYSTGMVQF